MASPRSYLSYGLLLLARSFSKLFYRGQLRWIEPPPENPWQDIRIIALLNHTSLYEWLFVSLPPRRFLLEIADKAVIPVADITLARPFIGPFFRLLTANVIGVTRKKDETWQRVIDSVNNGHMVVLLPEGRMKRANGLDKEGKPMSVRGGVADLITAIPEGRMLLVISDGLHHIQVPGQALPKTFKPIGAAMQVLDLKQYRDDLGIAPGEEGFKYAVMQDLDRRRDAHSNDPSIAAINTKV